MPREVHVAQLNSTATQFYSLELLISFSSAFLLSLVVYPFFISWIKSKQFRQFLREDGPASHAYKEKTPTAGGIVFVVLSVVLPPILWYCLGLSPQLWHFFPLLVAGFCGVIGFLDDYSKVSTQSNTGISGYIRLGLETLLGVVLGLGLIAVNQNIVFLPAQLCPLFGGTAGGVESGALASLTIPPVLFVLLTGFLVAATSNSLNLHDGMDGLAAGTSVQVLAVTGVMLVTVAGGLFDSNFLPYGIEAAVLAGTLCGFLMFNRYPAKIFMGDTGSLFIGGLIASLVAAGGLVLWFVPLSLIYIVESMSVISQVVYFKLTKPFDPPSGTSPLKVVLIKLTRRLPGEGKRLFRMAPIHHHFEAVLGARGWAEWHVVAMFWLVQFILCMMVLTLYFAFS